MNTDQKLTCTILCTLIPKLYSEIKTKNRPVSKAVFPDKLEL